MMHQTKTRREVIAGSATLAAASLMRPFTAAAAGASLDFLVVGDWGRDGASHQREVATAMGHQAEKMRSRFVVTTGDNFYEDGVESVDDPQWKTSFEDVYTAASLSKPWHAVLGNHDYRGNPQAQLDYAKTSTRWRLPARYYQLAGADIGVPHVDLFMLDSSPLVNQYRQETHSRIQTNVLAQDVPAQLAWLDRALAQSRAAWKMVFAHHPVFSGGSSHGNTPEMIAQVEPILERHGVRAFVFGHDHDLQHIVRRGIHHIGTGAGSEVRPVAAVEGTRFCLSRSGFAAMTVAEDRLRLQFHDYTGRQVYEAMLGRESVAPRA